MDYINNQPPKPLGARLPAAILTQIYHLAITHPSAIPLDSTRRQPRYPPLLQTSSHVRSRFLPAFFQTNTFTLRRASLCKRAENKKNPALMPMYHRVHIRKLILQTYNGAHECMNLALGPQCNDVQSKRVSCININIKRRPKQDKQQSCPFCNPYTFPPLQAIFPRLRSVTVDVAANRDSGLVWEVFCEHAVRKKRHVWVACTGVGEGVLTMSGERRLGMKVWIVDGKIKGVWDVVRRLGRDEVRRFVEYGWRSDGVWQAMRVSERVADGILRLFFWYYDVLCGREAGDGDGDEGASDLADDGSEVVVGGEDEQRVSDRTGIDSSTAHVCRWLGLSAHTKAESRAVNGTDENIATTASERLSDGKTDKHVRFAHTAADKINVQNDSSDAKDGRSPKRQLDLRWDTRQWSRDFLTPLNWALRVWLKPEKRDQNHKYARIVEGGGVRDVAAAEKMMDALLEDISNIPQSGELRAGV